MEVNFKVNGRECKILAGEISPDTSLNTYLRTHLCLTGTKFMCQEGGCGCCNVAIQGVHPVSKEQFTLAINSCLFLVYSCHDLSITTIEGLGNKKSGYHSMQQRLAHFDGSQCGFCSPGFIMNMFSLYIGKYGSVTAEEIEDSFGGNICRCTGYRPILDAFKSFATDGTQDLNDLCRDIEDLSLEKCPKSGKICAGKCRNSLHIKPDDNATWHKVYTLGEVLQILSSVGSQKYRLVAGNTAHGVYRMPYDIEVFIDVSSVTELRDHTIGNTIVLGGNVTITEWMAILLEASDQRSGFSYCRLVRNHLNQMATIPVRNVGTIAGNLMIKHDHNEFISDIFLVLATIGATITITDTNGDHQTVSPRDFLTVDMDKKVITLITMPWIAPDRYRLKFYKVSDRAQNATIYMNAGFLLEIDQGSGFVISSTIVYGGVNPSFVRAKSVEKCINGKDLFHNKTIQSVVNEISSKFVFDDSLPNTSAEFRRILAKGLFYKVVLSLAPRSIISPKYQSGSSPIYRPLSSGKQIYQSTPALYPLTQPITKVEALVQCSGEAEYVNDIYVHNSLWATFVLSNDPLKTIASIDASEALAVKGVKAFFSAKDIPGVNSFTSQKNPAFPSYLEPEEVFCSGKVLFHGQPVGMIVAEKMSQAVYAADLVKIHYDSKVKDEGSIASLYRYFRGDPVDKDKVLPTLDDVRRSILAKRTSIGSFFKTHPICSITVSAFAITSVLPGDLIQVFEGASAAFLANIELVATHQFSPDQIAPYIIYGVSCAEIEIDVLTGDFQLRRVDIVEDVGQSISPRVDVGQVEGAFIMGMGYWLHEKLVYNRITGELLTDRSWNYKPPGAKDIPVDFRVTLLQTISSASGILGSKACSEPAVSMAVVVVSALRKALESARKDAGAPDIFITLNASTTKEDILILAGTPDEQFAL
uniref:Uncharacterized protein n=1 Tax=Phlebotomus papatasi TaxID=29031 RepID=A0A1B0DAA3_PHLPP